jgi:hypothetical protein
MSGDYLKAKHEAGVRGFGLADEPSRGRYSASKRMNDSMDSNEFQSGDQRFDNLNGDDLEADYHRADASNLASQMKALMSFLTEINDLTKNSNIKDLMKMKKEIFILRNENERLKKENKNFQTQLKQKEKEISVLTTQLSSQSAVECRKS